MPHMSAHRIFRNAFGTSIAVALEILLDALRPTGGAGRIQHVVAGHFVRDRRGRLRGGLLVEGTEARLGLVHHVEQRSAGSADQAPDLLGAFRRGDEDLCAAILDDVGDLVLRQVAADRGVVEARALRRPADFHEGEAVFHQQRDVVAGLQAERTKQMRALVRELVEFAIGDRLAGRRHLIGDLVRVGAGVDGRVGHGCFLEASKWSSLRTQGPITTDFYCLGWMGLQRDLTTITCGYGSRLKAGTTPLVWPQMRTLLAAYSRSTMVTLAMPPPSHMVCRP